MSLNSCSYNVNKPNTDFINLDMVKLDLNQLVLAKVIIENIEDDNQRKVYGILCFKDGSEHIVDAMVVNNLDTYCR